MVLRIKLKHTLNIIFSIQDRNMNDYLQELGRHPALIYIVMGKAEFEIRATEFQDHGQVIYLLD
jgi:hypothetical protein